VAAKGGKVEQMVENAITKAMHSVYEKGVERGRAEAKEIYRLTERRLYAYPALKDNIETYKKDIADLQKEEPGRSKDLVFFSVHGGGIRLSPDEIQEGRIRQLEGRIYRDEAEIKEIDIALESVKNDPYFPIIDLRYWQQKSDDEIAEIIACDASTVRRNKSRLIRMIAVKLYGASAV
jgi:hypothetical protein